MIIASSVHADKREGGGATQSFLSLLLPGSRPLFKKKSHHFARCIGASRIGKTSLAASARPAVARAVNQPLFVPYLAIGVARDFPGLGLRAGRIQFFDDVAGLSLGRDDPRSV